MSKCLWCFILAGLAFCILLPLGAEATRYFAYRRRRARFASRPNLSFDEWYAAFYGKAGPSRALARRICEEIAREVGVEPTQIFPTDRFDDGFIYKEWWAYQGNEVEAIYSRIARFLERQRAVVPQDFAPGTVEEMIAQAETILIKVKEASS